MDPTGTYVPESYDAAALIALSIAAAGSADRTGIRDKLLDVANAPGEKIYAGELAKGLELAAAGTDIDYVGAHRRRARRPRRGRGLLPRLRDHGQRRPHPRISLRRRPGRPRRGAGPIRGAGMIRVEDLHMHFGGIRAVDGVTVSIAKGSITGLIGPNGAGKSTLFNVIAGLFPPTSGRVWLDGEEITGLPPHALFHKGLLRTFQIAHEFSTLTVRENLMMVPAEPARRGALGHLVQARPRPRPRGRGPRQGRRRDRVPRDRPRGGRARRQPLRRPEEAPRARPHHDGRPEDRLPRRGRRRRQPHAPRHHRRRHPQAQPRARLHLLPRRARHGLHRPPLHEQPGHRHGRGQAPRRRRPRRGDEERGGHRGLPRPRPEEQARPRPQSPRCCNDLPRRRGR